MTLLAALLLASSPASAAPVAASAAPGAAPPRWTQKAYVQAVLADSPDTRSAVDSLEAAGARARARWARAFAPSASFSGVVTPAKLDRTGRFTFDSWRVPSNDLTLTPGLSWNLFNSLQDRLGARSSELTREESAESLEAARQSEALSAVSTYWGLYLRAAVLEVSRQNLAVQREQYDLTLDRYKHGMKSLSDLLKTETDWRSTELSLETNEAERRLALFAFNVKVGVEEGAEAALDTDLALGTTVPPLLSDGLRAAMLQRPEMRKSRVEVLQAELSHRLARISAGPTLSLDFDASHAWSGSYGRSSLDFGAGSAVYGLSLRLALPGSFNLYSQLQDVRASSADLRRAHESAESLRRSVRQEVYEAHIGLTRALRSYEISQRKEEISRQNLDIGREEYSQGSADVIRLSQAQSDFVNAQAERLTALHDAKINTVRWKRAIGEPIWR